MLVISNRPRASRSADLTLLARLLPELYSTRFNYNYLLLLVVVAVVVIVVLSLLSLLLVLVLQELLNFFTLITVEN